MLLLLLPPSPPLPMLYTWIQLMKLPMQSMKP